MFLFNLIPDNVKKQLRYKLLNFISQSPSVSSLNDSVESLRVSVQQLNESLRLYNLIQIPPPEKLQRRIVGGYYDDFISSGYRNIDDFNFALSKHGKSIEDFTTVLDFGCGCGRIFMPVNRKYPHLKIYGSDIDEEAIEYCNQFYSSIGQFEVNSDRGPSTFDDSLFDLVYGISVFTHLPEDMQLGWLEDLHRITKPGAFLLLSVENEKSKVILKGPAVKEFEERGFYFFEGGITEGLPKYYRTTLHSHEYVRRVWSKYFEVLDIIPKGMMDHQDLVVCRKRTE